MRAFPPEWSRRSFLGVTGAAAAFMVSGTPALAISRTTPGKALPPGLFTMGVASGDPLPDGVVLWTRLAPLPLLGGGMPPIPVPVDWEVAEDERFAKVVARGTEQAVPEFGHSVHAEANGLRPDRPYFYRFRAGLETSPVGRTRTAPAADRQLRRLRFAMTSCTNWQDGYFTPYRHLAAEELDFVAFLGDFIYESKSVADRIRVHDGVLGTEPTTLVQYRNRYGQYHTDPDMTIARAAAPWIVTWDDHEVDNNWAADKPQDPDKQTPEAFRARRIAAAQAFYEHMPLRRAATPHGVNTQLYRRFHFGQLASMHVLDTRQYRSYMPSITPDPDNPAQTMTGQEQEDWLVQGMQRSGRGWNLLANQVMWAENDQNKAPGKQYDFDHWEGYRIQRRRLLEFFGSGKTSNPVVLTGDRHATWVCDLKPDFADPDSPVTSAEITGTSISSGGDPDNAKFHRDYDPIMAESPHWKYIDQRRGYMLCDVTPDEMRTSLRLVNTVWQPTGTTVSTAAEFLIESGNPGVEVVSQEPLAQQRSAAVGKRYNVDDDKF